MENEKITNSDEKQIAEAIIERKKRISFIWIVPFIALAIGIFLAVQAIVNRGPAIEISFKNAEGLEEGITLIKYKDVAIGKVNQIIVSDDLERVIVKARLKKWAKNYINKNTKFWLVKARMSAGEITGLKTLISGIYIGIDPGKKGKQKYRFKGLDKPPAINSRLPGKKFKLKAETLGSLDIGSSIFYKKINVGKVVDYNLQKNFKGVDIDIFIRAPYDKLIIPTTRFWNDSGIDLVLNADGVKLHSESLTSILIGGIAFDNPEKLNTAGRCSDKKGVFTLYKSKDEYFEKIYTQKIVSLVYFNTSVKGLSIGAPVEFRGIPVGKVMDITLEFDKEKKEFRIPVLIETEPGRISVTGDKGKSPGDLSMYKYLVKKGLRAQLRTGNLLTGQLYIDLDIYKDAPKSELKIINGFPVLPAMPTPFDEITNSITKFFKQIDKIPMEDIGNELHKTVIEARQLFSAPELKESIVSLDKILKHTEEIAKQLNKTIAPELTSMIKNVHASSKNVEKLLSPDSRMVNESSEVLSELSRAARSVRELSDFLEKHPEALFYGKGNKK